MSEVKRTIWINGPFGKMGSELVKTLQDFSDISITGAISPDHVGQKLTGNASNVEVVKDIQTLLDSTDKCDVFVDFTFATVAFGAALMCAANDINFVSGTTGLTIDQKLEIEAAFAKTKASAIIASNFSLGAVMMMEFSAQAAPYFKEIEIVETHHTRKLDSPSGTAITTANMINDARRDAGQAEAEVPTHSLRLSGAIAHQQVHLSSPGEILRIEHDANDRQCFMPGVIMSIEKVSTVEGVIYSISPLLFDSNS